MIELHLAGGAPSTGSSLVRSIMNAHPEVMAGPETYLMAHPALYEQWSQTRYKMFRRGWSGLKNETPFRYNGVQLEKPWYGWTEAELQDLTAKSADFETFCEAYFGRAATREGVGHVVEKSPVNTYTFRHFQKHFARGKRLHFIRDPYDTIASMMARGKTPYQAVSLYLFNTAFGLADRNSDGYMEIRYEALTADPQGVMEVVMRGFGLSMVPEMLAERKEAILEATQMPGWNYDETDQVRTGSVGRFEKCDTATRDQILLACESLVIAPAWRQKYSLTVATIADICRETGYHHRGSSPGARGHGFGMERLQEQVMRRLKGYPNCFGDYPIQIDR